MTNLTHQHLEDGIMHESQPHEFVAFASDLYDVVPDLERGWPVQITTTLGNKMPLMAMTKKIDADGDVQYVRYRQANGCIDLKIYND